MVLQGYTPPKSQEDPLMEILGEVISRDPRSDKFQKRRYPYKN